MLRGRPVRDSKHDCNNGRRHSNNSNSNRPACEALRLLVSGVAMPAINLTADQYQSFRCGYGFIWRKRRVRPDFQKIVLTTPEFALRKDTKLTGLSTINHFPKI